MAAAWIGRILPKFVESPLDARIERLRVDFDDTQLNQLPKHPTERCLSRIHIIRLASAQYNYTVIPWLCIRATNGYFLSGVQDTRREFCPGEWPWL